MDRFIRRKNIDHYRQLLQSGELDEPQRRTILKLLAAEEAKETDAAAATRERDHPKVVPTHGERVPLQPKTSG